MRIKKNDNVMVITGKDRGKQGKVLRVLLEDNKVLIEGMNLKKKHQRPRKQGEKGQMVDMPHPIDLSNVLLSCSSCGKGVRMGAKMNGTKKVRICKKCSKEI